MNASNVLLFENALKTIKSFSTQKINDVYTPGPRQLRPSKKLIKRASVLLIKVLKFCKEKDVNIIEDVDASQFYDGGGITLELKTSSKNIIIYIEDEVFENNDEVFEFEIRNYVADEICNGVMHVDGLCKHVYAELI